MERIELLIFKNKDIQDFIDISEKYMIVNVYIKVSLENISKTRKKLIDLNYTTRLFITYNNEIKEEYIFGKLKKSKGVFNEKCKNSIIREDISSVISVSSNEGDSIIVDDSGLFKEENRDYIIY